MPETGVAQAGAEAKPVFVPPQNPCRRVPVRVAIPGLLKFASTEEAARALVHKAIFDASRAARAAQNLSCDGDCVNPVEQCTHVIYDYLDCKVYCYVAEDRDHNPGYMCTCGPGQLETMCFCVAST